MPAQSADIIDFQAFRQSRGRQAAQPAPAQMATMPMQPMLMWVPYWGFFPVMAMGIPGHGA